MRKNRGYATVEACLIVPLFLFFMLAVGDLAMALLAEAHIHQSLAEAADDTAVYAYLADSASAKDCFGTLADIATLTKQFHTYLGKDANIQRVVKNGVTGIILSIIPDRQNKKIFIARTDFWIGFHLPVLGRYYIRRTLEIKKKTFTGYGAEEDTEKYVYITPNESVYHVHRSCSHLSLSISEIREGQKGSYQPCSFCGNEKTDRRTLYVSKTGNVYHSRRNCSGLKRTVRRAALSKLPGLTACQRCGR